jgi:hypothetical protein
MTVTSNINNRKSVEMLLFYPEYSKAICKNINLNLGLLRNFLDPLAPPSPARENSSGSLHFHTSANSLFIGMEPFIGTHLKLGYTSAPLLLSKKCLVDE